MTGFLTPLVLLLGGGGGFGFILSMCFLLWMCCIGGKNGGGITCVTSPVRWLSNCGDERVRTRFPTSVIKMVRTCSHCWAELAETPQAAHVNVAKPPSGFFVAAAVVVVVTPSSEALEKTAAERAAAFFSATTFADWAMSAGVTRLNFVLCLLPANWQRMRERLL